MTEQLRDDGVFSELVELSAEIAEPSAAMAALPQEVPTETVDHSGVGDPLPTPEDWSVVASHLSSPDFAALLRELSALGHDQDPPRPPPPPRSRPPTPPGDPRSKRKGLFGRG